MSTDQAVPDDPGRASQLRRSLVAGLTASGHLHFPEWQAAFDRVPRHVFVPRFFFDREHDGRYAVIDGSNPIQHEQWLSRVYADEPLITQLNGDDTAWATAAETGSAKGVPTSSSTMPGLMVMMLEALGIGDGMRVLEVGTGTGYNVALLSERLGSGLVTSVDLDRGLVTTARERLGELGYTPTLATVDGTRGYPPNAPYDRILATVALPRIPSAWIEQTREGGRILLNVYRDLGGGALALLTVRDGQAEGHFLPAYGGFMPIRSVHIPAAHDLLQAADASTGQSRPISLDWHVLDDPSFGFFIALRLPAQRVDLTVIGDNAPSELWLLGRDGSWASLRTDEPHGHVVVQRGKQQLWDELETAHADWERLGEPERQALGLTVQSDGRHVLWCGRSDNHAGELQPEGGGLA
jgi:protein-L-isoaspartate(D-aspartate) O-methyltransferase